MPHKSAWFTNVVALILFYVTVQVSAGAQSQSSASDWGDALVKWGTTCSARGCILQTDVLRGVSGDPAPPDPRDPREYIGLNVALDRKTSKPAYFSFLVDPRVQRDQGVFITFAKTVGVNGRRKLQLDPKGPIRIPIFECFEDYCAARVPLGITEEGKDSYKIDLLQSFLNSDHLLVLYVKGGKPYRTGLILSSFKKEYARLMVREMKTSGTGPPISHPRP